MPPGPITPLLCWLRMVLKRKLSESWASYCWPSCCQISLPKTPCIGAAPIWPVTAKASCTEPGICIGAGASAWPAAAPLPAAPAGAEPVPAASPAAAPGAASAVPGSAGASAAAGAVRSGAGLSVGAGLGAAGAGGRAAGRGRGGLRCGRLRCGGRRWRCCGLGRRRRDHDGARDELAGQRRGMRPPRQGRQRQQGQVREQHGGRQQRQHAPGRARDAGQGGSGGAQVHREWIGGCCQGSARYTAARPTSLVAAVPCRHPRPPHP